MSQLEANSNSAPMSAGSTGSGAASVTDFHFPHYFPLHSSLTRKFEKIYSDHPSEYTTIVQNKNQIIQSTKEYIDFILDEENGLLYIDTTVLDNNLRALETLLYAEYQMNILLDSTRESKSRIRHETKEEQPLTLDTLQEYQGALVSGPNGGSGFGGAGGEGKNFGEKIQLDYRSNTSMYAAQDSFQSFLKNSDCYTYLRNVSFIVLHPEDPIIDSNDSNDEELSIAGGKVSLKDPISLQFFTQPLITKTCRHVFERESIESMFHSSGIGHNPATKVLECPTDGCKERFRFQDLVPDELMKLRVRIYRAASSRDR